MKILIYVIEWKIWKIIVDTWVNLLYHDKILYIKDYEEKLILSARQMSGSAPMQAWRIPGRLALLS